MFPWTLMDPHGPSRALNSLAQNHRTRRLSNLSNREIPGPKINARGIDSHKNEDSLRTEMVSPFF